MGHLMVSIGAVAFAILLPSAHWAAAVEEQYRDFLADGPATWQVEVQADPSVALAEKVWVRKESQTTRFRLHTSAGQIDFLQRRATLAAATPQWASAGLDRLLSYVLMHILPAQEQSILLHGVGVAVDGRGHVFFGPSGAGKTTIASLAVGKYDLFSDENLILRYASPHPLLLATPFWGSSTPAHLIQRARRRLPIGALYALRHGPEFALERLTASDAVLSLLLTEKVAADDPQSLNGWLAVVEKLLAAIPVFRLTFRPTPELWGFLGSAGLFDTAE